MIIIPRDKIAILYSISMVYENEVTIYLRVAQDQQGSDPNFFLFRGPQIHSGVPDYSIHGRGIEITLSVRVYPASCLQLVS